MNEYQTTTAGLRILLGDQLFTIFMAVFVDDLPRSEVATEHYLSRQELDDACTEIERLVGVWMDGGTP